MAHAHTLHQNDDPFHDVTVGLITVLLVFFMLASTVGAGLIYYGDDVAAPSWNARIWPLP